MVRKDQGRGESIFATRGNRRTELAVTFCLRDELVEPEDGLRILLAQFARAVNLQFAQDGETTVADSLATAELYVPDGTAIT